MNVIPTPLPKDPLDRAVAIAGSPSALAKKCQVTPQAVNKWLRNREVPPRRCATIEQVCRGLVTRAQLRPDVFGELPASDQYADPPPAPDLDADRIGPAEETA